MSYINASAVPKEINFFVAAEIFTQRPRENIRIII